QANPSPAAQTESQDSWQPRTRTRAIGTRKFRSRSAGGGHGAKRGHPAKRCSTGVQALAHNGAADSLDASQDADGRSERVRSTEIIDKLNKEINAALTDPKVKARLADLGGTMVPGSPADFGKLGVDDKEKWAKVIRAAGIKAEGSLSPIFRNAHSAKSTRGLRGSCPMFACPLTDHCQSDILQSGWQGPNAIRSKTARVHHAAWRCGGMAARGAGAAGGDAGGRVSQRFIA